jgi:hypothetical protein
MDHGIHKENTSAKIQKDKKRVYMVFGYHLSFKLLIDTAVVIFFVKCETVSLIDN